MGGGDSSSMSNLKFNLTDPYRTIRARKRLRDARPDGWVICFSICTGTLPRAQNRVAKGSTLL